MHRCEAGRVECIPTHDEHRRCWHGVQANARRRFSDEETVPGLWDYVPAERQLSSRELEVVVLDRGNGRRAFRRILEAEVAELLAGRAPAALEAGT
jgi:hypothetical protein